MKHLSFLFWNLQGKDLSATVTALIREYGIDVALLAECKDAVVERTRNVLALRWPDGSTPRTQWDRPLAALTSLPAETIVEERARDGSLSAIWLRVCPPDALDVLVTLVHLPSRLHKSSSHSTLMAAKLAETVVAQEEEHGHGRSLVVGDLNLAPFEEGVVAAHALHAVMDRRVAAEMARTVSGKERAFFYNPMWGLFGDRTPGPSGTYFRRSGDNLEFFWHMFDQVLVRPTLAEALLDVRIVDKANGQSLLAKSERPAPWCSDHLPLYFVLDLGRVR